MRRKVLAAGLALLGVLALSGCNMQGDGNDSGTTESNGNTGSTTWQYLGDRSYYQTYHLANGQTLHCIVRDSGLTCDWARMTAPSKISE